LSGKISKSRGKSHPGEGRTCFQTLLLSNLETARSLYVKYNMSRKLYLRVGDIVEHRRFSFWGKGHVVEEKHSSLSGGFCMVRILFDDGVERSFINDLDSQSCCYYFGIRLIF
jgi:hypothetical protein